MATRVKKNPLSRSQKLFRMPAVYPLDANNLDVEEALSRLFVYLRTGGRLITRTDKLIFRCFRHQLLLPRPYLVLTKPLRLDLQCQRGASVKIGWKYLDD